MVPTVYLDSSDYSVLCSASKRPDLLHIRKRLSDLSELGEARFVYSGVVISEMAPLQPEYSTSATHLAEVLTALCRRNALPSIDRLLKREFEALRIRAPDLSDPLDPDGNWFPDLGRIATPTKALQTAKTISEEIQKIAKNRQQRRAANSTVLKKGRLRPSAIDSLSDGDLSAILQMYPMRPTDARVIERYVLGQATAAEADSAFLESLRDPAWMMRWFAKHHQELGPVVQWVRGPSEKLLAIILDLVEKISGWMNAGPAEREFGRHMLQVDQWAQEQDKVLLSVACALLEKHGQNGASVEDLSRFCPGLTTWIRSAHWSMRLSLLEHHARKPKASDFVDSLHSMYAPYLDVFRADDYMTPILAPLAKPYKTIICGKLASLPEVIAKLNKGGE